MGARWLSWCHLSVYPCAYREHCNKCSPILTAGGLSLCIQGTWVWLRSHQSLRTVYPCAYREHVNFIKWWRKHSGLSLCIQGTFFIFSRIAPPNRFIPVHTGNILQTIIYNTGDPVYPCAYREHYVFRMFCHSCNRFIPVHTGNIPIITNCFIIKILTSKFLPIF